jgi:exopolysaccharide biosynthesis WecB/TagA/CpsF family protein
MEGTTGTLQISDCDLEQFLATAARYGMNRYGYAVTPNVDHLIRYRAESGFREIYRTAAFVLLDSRFLASLLGLTAGLRLPTCTGSDLTLGLFESVIAHDDALVLIGGTHAQAEFLRSKYSLTGLRHYNPPMGFIKDPSAIESCLRFIESCSPFRFCFLAVGCPQQERVAAMLMARGRARGLALCVGGAINFLTGAERRAPVWMQNNGLEWLYRLLQDPARMAKRYLVRGPRIFLLLPSMKFVLRSDPVQSLDGSGPSVEATVPSVD